MDLKSEILWKILMIPGILVAFTLHEYGHAWVANRLGDKTPKFQGRLTLNPISHIDPIGFLMILLVGFGWAKPIETNPSAYKHYYKDDLKVSVAGVVGNFIAAVLCAALYGIFNNIFSVMNTSVGIVGTMIEFAVQINCMLIFFNLLPLPGLDGFHILRDLFPKFFYDKAEFLYKYQMVILIAFILIPAFRIIIDKPTQMLYRSLMMLSGII